MYHFIIRTALLAAIILSAAFSAASAQKAARITLRSPGGDTLAAEGITHLCPLKDGTMAIASSHGIIITANGTVKATYDVRGEVLAMAESGDGGLYVGTDHGLRCIRHGAVRLLEIPALSPNPPVTALAATPGRDASVWIGTKGYGVFVLRGEAIEPRRGAPNITSLAVTEDGSVWIGTYVGLHRIFPDGRYVNYAEEIQHEGIAIPDNIIEQIFADKHGNLWVFMSEAVSVITPENLKRHEDHIDPLSYAFIGSRGNTVTGFAESGDGSYWIATKEEGVMSLRGIEIAEDGAGHEHGLGDILTLPKGNLRSVNQIITDGKFVPTAMLADARGNIWIADERSVWRIAKSEGPKAKRGRQTKER